MILQEVTLLQIVFFVLNHRQDSFDLLINKIFMAKAPSFKSEPWTALQRGSYSIQEDDFIHDKLLTFKLTKKASTSTIVLKETFNQKEGKLSGADDLKFWFPFREDKTLYGTLKNDSYKLHYDNGLLTQGDTVLNFYGSIQGKKDLLNPLLKIGLQTRNGKYVTNWRLRFNSDNNNLTLYNKAAWTVGKWSYGVTSAYSIFDKVWNHSAFQLGWTDQSGNNYFLRTAGSKKYERVDLKRFLDEVTLNFVHKSSDATRFGVELKASVLSQQIANASVVWEHKSLQKQNTAIKIRGDLNRNLAFSIKNNIAQYGSYIFGVQVSDFGRANRFSYGLQLDLNL